MNVARAVVALIALAACPGPRHPYPVAGELTLELGGRLRGVAGDGEVVFTATVASDRTTLAARRGGQVAWQQALAGTAGPIATSGALVVATLAGTGTVADIALRGAPGAVVVGCDRATGTVRWKLAIDASEWSLVTAIAAIDNDVLVGGSFGGTLRANTRVVSSAGKSDGFVARITRTGEVAWLVRVGGPNADTIQGVAASTDGKRVAIAGTFAPGADLLGEPLVPIDERTPRTDVFVAELDAAGARKWQHVFGGPLDDSVAGVAIDGKGRIAVAATVRESLKIDVHDISVQGPSDGLLVFYSKDGTAGPSIPIGGGGPDGLAAIIASGDRVVVAGFFAGTARVGRETIKANGDDVVIAAFDGEVVTRVWRVDGAGREEITGLAPVPGGFVAGIAHTTAATIDGQLLAAPSDPLAGAGVIVRSTR